MTLYILELGIIFDSGDSSFSKLSCSDLHDEVVKSIIRQIRGERERYYNKQ